jgi:uncharacterized membrane protein YphA (DoxX/SURF4 family)
LINLFILKMKALITISRIITGAVFIFSGFVKAVDPLGSTYKFTDYFIAFHIQFLEPVALPLAVILASVEFLIGISMLLGYRYKIASWGLFIFMVFFTILTFILALTNPVSDCGCFGDAIIMTNWQTFFKNIILLPFAILIFVSRKRISPGFPALAEWIYLSVFALLAVVFQIHALRHLPLLDFRPYSTGTHIPDKMIIPEGAQTDEYKTYLYYEKDGQVMEFTEDNYPWQDSTWKFVDTRHILLKKGYEPPIHDFTIVDENGFDRTESILKDPDYTMLLIAYDLKKADTDALKMAGDLAAFCTSNNCSFYCLTASSRNEIKEITSSLNLNLDFYFTDEITLKTMIRSNPGLILLKEGTIIGMWHYRDYPVLMNAGSNYLAFSLDRARKDNERSKILLLTVFVMLIAAVIRITYSTDF